MQCGKRERPEGHAEHPADVQDGRQYHTERQREYGRFEVLGRSGVSSSWELRLPEKFCTSTTLNEGSVSWALLTGKKKDEHLKATFGNAIQALVDEGLDVTENTPRTVLFFSPIGETDTADMKTWMKHDFHNFGLPPNKEKIDETIA